MLREKVFKSGKNKFSFTLPKTISLFEICVQFSQVNTITNKRNGNFIIFDCDFFVVANFDKKM